MNYWSKGRDLFVNVYREALVIQMVYVVAAIVSSSPHNCHSLLNVFLKLLICCCHAAVSAYVLIKLFLI